MPYQCGLITDQAWLAAWGQLCSHPSLSFYILHLHPYTISFPAFMWNRKIEFNIYPVKFIFPTVIFFKQVKKILSLFLFLMLLFGQCLYK